MGPRCLVPLLLLLLSACADLDDDSGPSAVRASDRTLSPPFDSLFRPAGRIVLEEPGSRVIAGIRFIAVDRNGRIALADRTEHRVRVHDGRGKLLTVLGRRGEGPGEFEAPFDVAFDGRGRLLVTEGLPRITRYSPALELDTVFEPRYPMLHHGIRGLAEGFLVVRMPGPGAGDRRVVAIHGEDGRIRRRLHGPDPRLYGTPYWLQAATFRAAVSSRHVFVTGSLLYPIRRYDLSESSEPGLEGDPIGTPPPSWAAVPPTERGQFRGPTQIEDFRAWYEGFTTISGLEVYGDSSLLVAHRSFEPDGEGRRSPRYRLDVYTVAGVKRYEDIELPGHPLAADSLLYLLVGDPPGPWTVAKYIQRAPGTGAAESRSSTSAAPERASTRSSPPWRSPPSRCIRAAPPFPVRSTAPLPGAARSSYGRDEPGDRGWSKEC